MIVLSRTIMKNFEIDWVEVQKLRRIMISIQTTELTNTKTKHKIYADSQRLLAKNVHTKQMKSKSSASSLDFIQAN